MYTPFVRILKKGYRLCHAGWKVETKQQKGGPAVYVSHHQNMRGPIHAAGLLPGEAHIWVFHPFLARQTCFQHFYHYTFRNRFHWRAPLAAAVAGVASLVVPPLLRGLASIPVYRDGRVLSTLRQSVKALEKGENLLIFPDKDYASKEDAMGELQTGFLSLERLYHRKTGRHLAFIPLQCHRAQKTLCAGEPVYFREGQNFQTESHRVSLLLQNALNTPPGEASLPAEAGFAESKNQAVFPEL